MSSIILVVKTIRQTHQIKAPVEKVWKVLVDCKEIEGWGGGPCEMDDKVGTKFKLWGGDVHGKNIEVVPEKKLVQEWYEGDWPEPSIVDFRLTSKDDGTQVQLLHERVPDSEYESIDKGWNKYYLGPLKVYVEALRE